MGAASITLVSEKRAAATIVSWLGFSRKQLLALWQRLGFGAHGLTSSKQDLRGLQWVSQDHLSKRLELDCLHRNLRRDCGRLLSASPDSWMRSAFLDSFAVCLKPSSMPAWTSQRRNLDCLPFPTSSAQGSEKLHSLLKPD